MAGNLSKLLFIIRHLSRLVSQGSIISLGLSGLMEVLSDRDRWSWQSSRSWRVSILERKIIFRIAAKPVRRAPLIQNL